MKRLNEALRHRRVGPPPRSTRAFIDRFNHHPRHSVTALLRTAGPFDPRRDAYHFKNGSWPITEEDARILRERYRNAIEAVSIAGIGALRAALTALTVQPASSFQAGLPIAAIDVIVNRVSGDLRNQLLDKVVSSTPGGYGRCGGMAFSAYDFFLVGWPVHGFTVKPGSGDLRQYIWTRLLDSLDLNASTFLEWMMVLHILPSISKIASGALGAAGGGVVAGPPGAAAGGFIAGDKDVLKLGGAEELLHRTREHMKRLGGILAGQAAWPIGFVYGGAANPVDQHQVLAIDYQDHGDDTATLEVWDNNDLTISQTLALDFRGKQPLVVSSKRELDKVKGIICEEYSFRMPPNSLRR